MAIQPKSCHFQHASAMDDPAYIGTSKTMLPQTGCPLSKLPKYLLSPQKHTGCTHGSCLHKNAMYDLLRANSDLAKAEEAAFVRQFSEDCTAIVEEANLHKHTRSCYKYEHQRSREKNLSIADLGLFTLLHCGSGPRSCGAGKK